MIPDDEYALKAVLAHRGPVSVSIDASPPSFYFYAGGIYDAGKHECATDYLKADHVVMLVGYGKDEATGIGYWILRNSWGEFWGEGGYMRIAMEGNTCGVANHATFPILG